MFGFSFNKSAGPVVDTSLPEVHGDRGLHYALERVPVLVGKAHQDDPKIRESEIERVLDAVEAYEQDDKKKLEKMVRKNVGRHADVDEIATELGALRRYQRYAKKPKDVRPLATSFDYTRLEDPALVEAAAFCDERFGLGKPKPDGAEKSVHLEEISDARAALESMMDPSRPVPSHLRDQVAALESEMTVAEAQTLLENVRQIHHFMKVGVGRSGLGLFEIPGGARIYGHPFPQAYRIPTTEAQRALLADPSKAKEKAQLLAEIDLRLANSGYDRSYILRDDGELVLALQRHGALDWLAHVDEMGRPLERPEAQFDGDVSGSVLMVVDVPNSAKEAAMTPLRAIGDKLGGIFKGRIDKMHDDAAKRLAGEAPPEEPDQGWAPKDVAIAMIGGGGLAAGSAAGVAMLAGNPVAAGSAVAILPGLMVLRYGQYRAKGRDLKALYNLLNIRLNWEQKID